MVTRNVSETHNK